MSHTRIRKFNTKDTYPEQNLDNDLCQAVVAGNMVFLRGQVGLDVDTNESVGIGDVAAQTDKAMANIDMLLNEAGARMEDVQLQFLVETAATLLPAGTTTKPSVAAGVLKCCADPNPTE